ncbi:Thyroid adenoma-associated protein [Echinococcus granulosus]|uniref:Thyroid adenoma-associated protein n=2 Tax=Echinococcus granulosus TaxID=6210 RepID=W6UC20_ECHGR|nr:Thyroid adenoma-associated protein [Echinococcus granulosus]EUB58700.1 Thyroid adenoma-associated protein [Echinococcus granulosus]
MVLTDVPRFRNELSKFILHELNHVCGNDCPYTEEIDMLVAHGLSLCETDLNRLQFLLKVYKPAHILVSGEMLKRDFTFLLELLSASSSESKYNDTQVILCLRIFALMISGSDKLKCSFSSSNLDKLTQIQSDIFERNYSSFHAYLSELGATSFNCLLTNSVLLAQGLCHLERGPISEKLVGATADKLKSFSRLYSKIMMHSDFPSRRLGVIFGVMSVVLEPDFVDIASRMLNQITPQNRNDDPFVGLLTSYCFRQWTIRVVKSTNKSLLNQLTSNDELAPIFEFIFHHQNDPIDAVREAVMDNFELLVSLLMKWPTVMVTPSPFLQSLLTRVVEQPLWMRNTLVLVHRFFSAVFKETNLTSEQTIEWLISAGFPLIDVANPSDLSSSAMPFFALGCTLILTAHDVALSQSAGEVFALFAVHFSSAESEAMRAWFLALVWMAKQLRGVSRAFLDKIFNLAPSLPLALIENYAQCFTEEGLSTLLHSYRYCLTKKGLKRSLITLPDLALISRALRSQDYQLNQQTVGAIESLFCQAHLNDADLINLFIEAVDIGTCCFDRAARSRMCITITRVTEYFLSLPGREKNAVKRSEIIENVIEAFRRVASAILRHLHTGGVALHTTNALAFLVSFIEVLLSNRTETGLSQPLALLCSAMSELTGGICEDFDSSVEVLLSSFMVGLWSTFSEDRENAHKLILWLHLLKYMKPAPLVHLWRRTLKEVARSVRPDVNVVGGHLVRTLLAAPPLPQMEVGMGEEIEVALLRIRVTACKAVATVHHLLSALDAQIRVAEAGRGGLLMVSATGPFYPLLNILRTLLHDPEHCVPSRWFFENPPLDSLPSFPAGDSICNRLLNIAMHVARICSFVVFHSSPEGILILVDEDRQHTKVIPSGAGKEGQWDKTEEFAALMDDSAADAELVSALRRVVERPEHLVVNCWRSVREVALLLGGRLTRDALLSDPLSPQIDFVQLNLIADFFISQLIRSRHPGAFELTASGFQSFCEILLSAQEYRDVCQWPEQWLSVVIADLTDVAILPVTSQIGRLPLKYLQDAAYCATRRSAGLPFFVQTLLVVLHKTGRLGDLLNRTASALLAEINREAEATTVPSTCNDQTSLSASERRLHAMNVLRTLVRDATIGPLMEVHLEIILACALQGLDSFFWMIRNAALMLYSALMERIFGVNRTRDCESKKNRMVSSVFFAKFPGMRNFLLKTIEEAIGGLHSPTMGRAKLFALLNLLRRLLPPIQQATTDGTIVQAFVPLVFRCAGAADIRIRLIAARAFVAVLQPACLPRVARRILLIVSPYFTTRQPPHLQTNFVHGMLLHLLEILKCEYFPVCDMDAMQNSPHYAYLSEISALLSNMVAVCIDSTSNLCPIIIQTCLACGLTFGLSNMFPVIKLKRCHPSSSPCALDSSTMELLIQLCNTFKKEDPSLQSVIKDVIDVASPELKRVALGLLVRRLNSNDVDFSRGRRLLWYEDAINLLSEISSSPFYTHPSGGHLDLSTCSSQLGDELIAFVNLSHQPYSLISFHTSQLLAYLAIASTSDQLKTHSKLLAQCNQLLTSIGGIPAHLGPLLTVYALVSQNKDEVLDFLARYIDPKQNCPYWSTRAEALLAVDRFLSQNTDNRTRVRRHLHINLAVLRNLVLETDDEVLMIASATAFKVLPKTDKFPQKPLPPVILPAFLFNFISIFKNCAVSTLLDWFHEDLLKEKTAHCGSLEAPARVFVTEGSTVSTSIMVFTTLLCSAIKKWALTSPQEDKITFTLDQIHRRGLAQLSSVLPSEEEFSHLSGNNSLLRMVTHLFARLLRDLEEESSL